MADPRECVTAALQSSQQRSVAIALEAQQVEQQRQMLAVRAQQLGQELLRVDGAIAGLTSVLAELTS